MITNASFIMSLVLRLQARDTIIREIFILGMSSNINYASETFSMAHMPSVRNMNTS